MHSQPIRVLHLIDSLVAGGKERQLVELLKGLRSEPDIVCEVAILSDVVQYDAFWTLDVKSHFFPRRTRRDPTIFVKLFSAVRRFRPHIMHSWNSMCSIYGAPIAKLCGARFVNGFARAAPPAHSFRDPDYFRGKLTLPFSDVVVANSEAGLDAYDIPARKGICIHNGIDQTRFDSLAPVQQIRDLLNIETPHVVGMVGAFSHKKDYDTFVNAAAMVLAKRNDVTFVAIGDGPNRTAIEARIAHENSARIKLVGQLQDVENVVNAFSVGVLASTQGEGFSNAIMEYMALGKPVVATDCAGNRELIEQGETGYLVAAGDVGGIAQRVLALLDEPALATRLGENGRARIGREFGLVRMTLSYTRLYRELAQARSLSRHARSR
jgi:glycosyltransferase involved in cell wall biosynthesis